MYEDQTYETIMTRMLNRIPDTFDKREGSVIWDALSPCAVELVSTYQAFDWMMTEAYGDTASRTYLLRLCTERGITPYAASAATVQITTTPATLEIAVGQRFSSSAANYAITAKVSSGVYKAVCETAGTVGNSYLGTVLPIQYIDGLESATLSSILIYGEDEEDTEDLRARYMDSFDVRAFGGNRADYKEKCLAISGVGAVKIEPIWNGAGTVRLTILDTNYGIATSTLIDAIKDEFDPNSDGKGDGLAPIGHVVTVRTATKVDVTVNATFTFDTGYTWESCKTQIATAITNYIKTINTTWQDDTSHVVRITGVEAAALTVEGVLDIAGTKINGTEANLILTEYQLPVFLEVTH